MKKEKFLKADKNCDIQKWKKSLFYPFNEIWPRKDREFELTILFLNYKFKMLWN